MNVYLTFDIEIWCDGWLHLDARFPAAFERYVYGRSPKGEFALPATLEILNRHGLRGVFFVEPLFSARFGGHHLAEVVALIESAGQDVQLHLHPEWTDEIRPPPIADASRKRQHLSYYTRDEQYELLRFGVDLLRAQVRGEVYAFRAGSFAADRNTYHALAACGIGVDSSLNRVFDLSGADIAERGTTAGVLDIGGVQVYPVTVFTDGFGRARPAQVGACGAGELRSALETAEASGCKHFVIVSHNFEMLRPGSSEPDPIVVRRFESLCRYLGERPEKYRVSSFPRQPVAAGPEVVPRSGTWPTLVRLGEQAVRRVY